uniref:Uncharacterized protein n=1 Tax=Chromera velia CCMP2878 TaxID=1169474 RepID=A0A0G4GD56_9ALVE
MAKGWLPAYLKEWYEKYEEEHGVFSNWESLKTELTERLKLVGQLPHLWEEDVVEDYIKGLPNSIALDVAGGEKSFQVSLQTENCSSFFRLDTLMEDAQNVGALGIPEVFGALETFSLAGASTDIGPGHCASKVVELPTKLVFSGKREELQRWLKDVEKFFELNEVRESKKMKMAKGWLPAYLKEWYEKYEEEHGVFSNWESLKTELTERLKVTMERSIARVKL